MNLKLKHPSTDSTSNPRIGGLKLILKALRLMYIGGAIYFVSFGYYTTFLMAKARYRNVEEEVKVLEKYRYPSITFCYVFKHTQHDGSDTHDGGKYVWTLYYRHLIQQWMKSGNF